MVDVVVRTMESPERAARQAMGPADAVASVTTVSRLPSDFAPGPWYGVGFGPEEAERDPADVDLAALLPPGTKLTAVPVGARRPRCGRASARGGRA